MASGTEIYNSLCHLIFVKKMSYEELENIYPKGNSHYKKIDKDFYIKFYNGKTYPHYFQIKKEMSWHTPSCPTIKNDANCDHSSFEIHFYENKFVIAEMPLSPSQSTIDLINKYIPEEYKYVKGQHLIHKSYKIKQFHEIYFNLKTIEASLAQDFLFGDKDAGKVLEDHLREKGRQDLIKLIKTGPSASGETLRSLIFSFG